MTTKERSRLKTTDTNDTADDSRIDETRQLLSQALTALDADEHDRALSSLAAATNRLGERTWPEDHPAGDALEQANRAFDVAMIQTDAKRRAGKESIREALQLLIAAEEVSA